MTRIAIKTVVFLLVLATPQVLVPAQDPFRAHQYKTLKGVDEVALVVTGGDPRQFIAKQQIADFVLVNLKNMAPSLRIHEDLSSSRNWLLVRYGLPDRDLSFPCGTVHVELQRVVFLADQPSEPILTTVWHRPTLFWGGTQYQTRVEETVKALLTSFAADHHRANVRSDPSQAHGTKP